MTFEEAKKIFLNRGYVEVPGGTYYDADKWRESITVISKWLEQEPCEDAVSRQAVEEMIKAEMPERGMWEIEGDKEKETVCEVCVDLMQKLSELPSVTPKEKTGHWIIKDGKEQGYDIGGIKTWYIQIMCDKCGFIKTAIEGHTGQYHFCPSCGARMVSE